MRAAIKATTITLLVPHQLPIGEYIATVGEFILLSHLLCHIKVVLFTLSNRCIKCTQAQSCLLIRIWTCSQTFHHRVFID